MFGIFAKRIFRQITREVCMNKPMKFVAAPNRKVDTFGSKPKFEDSLKQFSEKEINQILSPKEIAAADQIEHNSQFDPIEQFRKGS